MKRVSLPCSPKAGLYGNRRPFPEPYLIYLLGFPVKEPSFQLPLMEPPCREIPFPRALHSSFKVPGIWALPGSRFLSALKGPCGERCPYPEPFLTYLPGSPVKEPPSTEPLQRETLHFKSPLYPSLKVPGRWAPFQVPQQGPYEKRCPSPEPFLHIFQDPQQRSPPPGSPNRAPIDWDAPEPFFS